MPAFEALNSVTVLPYLTGQMMRHDRDAALSSQDTSKVESCAGAGSLHLHVLRTDVAGMPLEWIDYKEAARLYHQQQVAYTCGTPL